MLIRKVIRGVLFHINALIRMVVGKDEAVVAVGNQEECRYVLLCLKPNDKTRLNFDEK